MNPGTQTSNNLTRGYITDLMTNHKTLFNSYLKKTDLSPMDRSFCLRTYDTIIDRKNILRIYQIPMAIFSDHFFEGDITPLFSHSGAIIKTTSIS